MAERYQKIFFSGIGGSGVSAIAAFMADKDHVIAGSDRAFKNNKNHPVYRFLKEKGIAVVPQDGSGINSSFDLAVFSTAIEDNNPDILKARDLQIKTLSRPAYLAEIVSEYKTIAVTGTSGKSTASGMLAFLMHRLGLKPNFIGGGRVRKFKTGNNAGNALAGCSDYLVIEACESDGTIVDYMPWKTIILNLTLDHNPVEKTAQMLKSLVKNTSENTILNGDDHYLKEFKIEDGTTFSIEGLSDYRATDILYKTFSTTFSVNGVRFDLSLPGKFNLYNSLSCIAILSETGVKLRDIANVIHEFNGIERRFDIHLYDKKRLVIDDYAHNPHKIASLMEAVKRLRKDICYIFQPHGFSPTRLMKDGYVRVFSENLRLTDHLILLPIFYGGGTVERDISSQDIAEGVNLKGRSVEVINNRETLLERTDEWNNYVIMGARDETLSDLAMSIAGRLKSGGGGRIRTGA